MRSLEFFRNVSIGQYMDTGSPVHRFTPATKYLWLLALATPAIAGAQMPSILAPLVASLVVGLIARIKLGFLFRGIKPVLPLLLILLLFQVLLGVPGDTSAVLFGIGRFNLTTGKLFAMALLAARTVSLMLTIALFTTVTAEGEIAHGIEDALSPVKRLGVPVHELSLAVAMAFRFIPIVAGELEKIVKAQAARGADFGSGRGGPLKKTKAYLPLFVPVIVRALERAETLAEAMEARGYISGDGRTRFVVYAKVRGETVIRIAALVFCAGALALGILR